MPTNSETVPEELEWRVVAATQMGEKSIMALTVINGRMTNLSVLQRLNNTVGGARYTHTRNLRLIHGFNSLIFCFARCVCTF